MQKAISFQASRSHSGIIALRVGAGQVNGSSEFDFAGGFVIRKLLKADFWLTPGVKPNGVFCECWLSHCFAPSKRIHLPWRLSQSLNHPVATPVENITQCRKEEGIHSGSV